ncbi:MAG: hypothetical protein AB7I27_01655 [Bacteriovoracaceae bacterium]
MDEIELKTYNFLMNFKNYFHENPAKDVRQILKKYNNTDHKTSVWNAFADSDLSGVNDDDFSIIPRLIPESYFPVIEKTCREITTFLMKLISLPESEVRAIIPPGPLRNFIINELEVLKFRNGRITGSFRFDMAIVGEPSSKNPPKLLEVNEIGFDGLARSTFFQNTLLSLIPELKKKVISLDTAAAEVRNMNRLGKEIVRLQYDCYNWDEEYLKFTANKMGSRLHLISPTQYKTKIDKDFPMLEKHPFIFKNGKIKVGDKLIPDALNMSFAFTLSDLKRDKLLYQEMVRSKTPQYGPFLTSLVASKTILILLNDETLRRKLLGSSKVLNDSILPAFSLKDKVDFAKENFKDLVIKHTDGCGGEQVFMNEEFLKCIKRTPRAKHHEWVLQQKTLLNTVDVNGILSRKKKVISDLGVFVHYDWKDGKFQHFEVGGLMSRGTNKGLKVNVSSGGLQIAVMLERGR